MTLFRCYYQWKITMVTQQRDEATGGEVWQRGSVKHRCVRSVYAHTEPRCLATRRESSRVIRTDPLRDVKTGRSPLRHVNSVPIIVAPFWLWNTKSWWVTFKQQMGKKVLLSKGEAEGMWGTSSPTGSPENGFYFYSLSSLSVWSVAFTGGYPQVRETFHPSSID